MANAAHIASTAVRQAVSRAVPDFMGLPFDSKRGDPGFFLLGPAVGGPLVTAIGRRNSGLFLRARRRVSREDFGADPFHLGPRPRCSAADDIALSPGVAGKLGFPEPLVHLR